MDSNLRRFDLEHALGDYGLTPKSLEFPISLDNVILPYSLKFWRIKYFAVLPNSAQKQIFVDKIFVV